MAWEHDLVQDAVGAPPTVGELISQIGRAKASDALGLHIRQLERVRLLERIHAGTEKVYNAKGKEIKHPTGNGPFYNAKGVQRETRTLSKDRQDLLRDTLRERKQGNIRLVHLKGKMQISEKVEERDINPGEDGVIPAEALADFYQLAEEAAATSGPGRAAAEQEAADAFIAAFFGHWIGYDGATVLRMDALRYEMEA